MTPRERYLRTMLFDNPDRPPFSPGGPRESTLKAWHRQGLPDGANWFQTLLDEIGLKPQPTRPQPDLSVSFRMIPEFEEKVLEHRDGKYIVQDWMGAVVEIADDFDYTYLRFPKDFVTRKWHKFPVESRADWEQMKARFDPASPGRHPANLHEICRQLQNRDQPVSLNFNGPFWQLREWCGFEGLCQMLIDAPDFVHDMVRFWTDFVSDTMRPVLERLAVDRAGISEDMAYKCHSMISPAMTREFLMPAYMCWVEELEVAGCPVIDMDSDGCIEELIPIWIDSGINCCDPIEVAAGNDIVEFRRRFGKLMAYTGGIDKRAIAAGGKVMEAELNRVIPPLLETGGFIPSCDHGVPSDITWPHFAAYARKLAQMTGWI